MGCCLTQVKILRLNDYTFLCTAGSNGYVTLWPLHDDEIPVFVDEEQPRQSWSTSLGPISLPQVLNRRSQHKVHQNSIQCLTAVHMVNGELILATSGDDGSLAFSRLAMSIDKLLAAGEQSEALNGHHSAILFATLVVPKAHACAVTAIQCLEFDASQKHYAHFVTSGKDQRLKTWHVEIEAEIPGAEGLSVRKGDNKTTAVTDLANIEVIDANQIILAGIGMEIGNIHRVTRTEPGRVLAGQSNL